MILSDLDRDALIANTSKMVLLMATVNDHQQETISKYSNMKSYTAVVKTVNTPTFALLICFKTHLVVFR